MTKIDVTSYDLNTPTGFITLVSGPSTSSYRRAPGIDTETIGISALMEYTSSQNQYTTNFVFEDVPVTDLTESGPSGSWTQTVVIPMPDVHARNQEVDGVTIKLKKIFDMRFKDRGTEISDYISWS